MPTADIRYRRRPHRLSDEQYTDPEATFHLTMHAMAHGTGGPTPFEGAVGEAVWERFAAEISAQRVNVVALCLMPDHLHAVVRPGSKGIVHWINAMKSLTTNTAHRAGWRGPLWQASFWDRYLWNAREVAEVIGYLQNNPVVAGLVERPEDWPWMIVAFE